MGSMIDAQRIDDKTKYGQQFDVGNIALKVITEFWGGRWHEPTIQLSITRPPSERHLLGDSPTGIKYEALADLEIAFGKVAREWERLDEWHTKKNYQKTMDSV